MGLSVFIFGGADEGDEKFGFFTEFKFELNRIEGGWEGGEQPV